MGESSSSSSSGAGSSSSTGETSQQPTTIQPDVSKSTFFSVAGAIFVGSVLYGVRRAYRHDATETAATTGTTTGTTAVGVNSSRAKSAPTAFSTGSAPPRSAATIINKINNQTVGSTIPFEEQRVVIVTTRRTPYPAPHPPVDAFPVAAKALAIATALCFGTFFTVGAGLAYMYRFV